MIDLLDTTFIIPICIESPDRYINTYITLSYLNRHLNTNIIVYEYDATSKIDELIKSANFHSIKHIFIENKSGNNIFHRTKFLNEMLAQVHTNVVVNYDIDIILQPNTYKKCTDLIKGGMDLVYPYFWGNSQYQVNYVGREKIKQTLSLDGVSSEDYNLTRSEYGQCQFFNTTSYKNGGMENEGFISYAPEDQERGYRFKKLGYKVMWSDDYVYHMEHTRGNNSSGHNPMMSHNNQLFEYIKTLSTPQLIEYYNNINYISKYKGINER